MFRMTCPVCGEAFEAQRRDARYCSVRCRVAAHRRRERIYGQIEEIPAGLDELDVLAARLRHVSADLAAAASTSSPEVAIVCSRLHAAVCEALWAEGML